MENYDLAIGLYRDLKAYDKIPEIINKRTIAYGYLLAQSYVDEAMYHFEREEINPAIENFETARAHYTELLKQAKYFKFEDEINKIEIKIENIDHYVDICREIKEADNMVDSAKALFEQGDYEHSLEQMNQAVQIYEQHGFTNRKNEANEVIIDILSAKDEAKDEALIRTNTLFLRIAFAITFVVVSLLYFGRKRYKGENRRRDTILYLTTIVALLGVLIISISVLSLQLGNAAYLLTFSMCLFFLMILNAYMGR